MPEAEDPLLSSDEFIAQFPDRALFALQEFFQTPERRGSLGEIQREEDSVHGGVLLTVVPRLSKVCKTVQVRSGHAGRFVQFWVGGEGINGTTISPHNLTESALAWAVSQVVEVAGERIPIIYPTSDPKYSILNNQLVNHATGIAIPMDEPVFVFRAKDRYALSALEHYEQELYPGDHQNTVRVRVEDFERFSRERWNDRMKFPDTQAAPE